MQSSNTGRLVRYLLLTIGSLSLCLCLSVAAFAVGRLTAAPAAVALEPTRGPSDAVPVATVADSAPTAFIATQPPESTPLPRSTPEPGVTQPPAQAGDDDPPLNRNDSLEPEDLEPLMEVWEHVLREYDGELPSEEALRDAIIQGSLETLNDENTVYLSPDTATRLREDMGGTFSGIGAFVRMTDEGYLRIVRPMSGQPAALAGLLPEDIVLAADGVELLGMTVDEAISRVRGPSGTPVTLTIQRDGLETPFDVTITRQTITIPTVESQMLDNQIGYVRLTQFNRLAAEQTGQAVEALLAQNPRALIFDLRDNPGGFLDQAVFVSDIFLPEGVVLYERGSNGIDETFRSETGHAGEAIPMVVLVNAGSASASELVAGAFQDRERAIVIGETTFGKGSVQQLYALSNGSELRVTVARWYTPNDRTVDGTGIIPDIEVLPSPIEFLGPDDTQLQRAIEWIMTGQ